jgi:hypothetical protein
MTAPVVHGFPDWGRYAAHATKIYTQQNGTTINGSTTYGPFFVGDQTHLAVVLNSSTDNLTLSLAYYIDEGGSALLGVQILGVAVDVGYAQSVPVLGPWVQVTVNPVTTPADIVLWLYGVAGNILQLLPDETSNLLVSQDVANIGAGATINTNSARVWPGEAFWQVFCNAASWAARVQSITAAGTINLVDYQDSNYVRTARQIFLPSCPTRLQLVNFDGAIRQYAWSLVARPLVPGG